MFGEGRFLLNRLSLEKDGFGQKSDFWKKTRFLQRRFWGKGNSLKKAIFGMSNIQVQSMFGEEANFRDDVNFCEWTGFLSTNNF